MAEILLLIILKSVKFHLLFQNAHKAGSDNGQ